MILRLLAAIVALSLSTAPVLGVFCGVDCGRAQADVAEVLRAGAGAHEATDAHSHAAHDSVDRAEATRDETAPADAPHDCHRPGGGDIEAIGPGSLSCTHLRFEPAPAQLVSAGDTPVTMPVRVPSSVADPSLDLQVFRWRITSAFDRRLALFPARTPPLRI